MKISVIIPVLNEGERLVNLVKTLADINSGDHEIIISSAGGDIDINDINDINEINDIKIIKSPVGRAVQMNAGADAAAGEVFWFLHADSVPAVSSFLDIERAVNDGAVGGFFRLYFYDSDNKFLKFISRTSHTRAKNFCLIFGDQGLFLRRDVFYKLGGFAPLALMEDWEISRRLISLHKNGLIKALDTSLGTSARNYLKNGIFKTWLKMNVVKTLYICGVRTEKLRKIYYGW